MPERPHIYMEKVDEDSAAMRLLIEQVRRLSDSVDRFSTTMSGIEKQLARMEAESLHAQQWREAHDQWRTKTDGRIDVLEDWKTRQDGGKALANSVLRHPIFLYALGWLAALGMAAWAILSGREP